MRILGVSSLSVHGQVTITKDVREHLKLKRKDKVVFILDEKGNVILQKS